VEVRTGDEPVVIETVEGTVRTRRGKAEHPNAVISGKPGPILGLLSGRIDLAEARRRGLVFQGDQKVLSRLVTPIG
jgi:hypothetical protein